MKISELFKKSRIASRLLEETLYAEALREIENGVRRDGLWARAVAKSGGNQESAKALYIDLRVQALRDELDLYRIQLRNGEAEASRSYSNEPSSQAEKAQLCPLEGASLDREARIQTVLREKLGREPTEQEINKAKWEGMCL